MADHLVAMAEMTVECLADCWERHWATTTADQLVEMDSQMAHWWDMAMAVLKVAQLDRKGAV